MTTHPDGSLDPTVDHYRELVEQISDVVTVVDRDGTVRYQSPSSRAVKGWEPTDLLGENMLAFIHPDDRDRVVGLMRAVIGDPGSRTDRIEYQFETPDGEYIWLSSTGSNPGPDSPIDGYVVSSRDVTDRKRLEGRLRRQRDRLEAFSTVVSHDLTAPLNVIDGSLDLAEETGEARHFERACRAVARIEGLTADILTLARDGDVVGDREAVSLAEAAADAWATVRTPEATLDVAVTATVGADPSRLQQVLENLFRNAVDHGGPGVEVAIEDLPDGAGFAVADDGPGLPDDHDRLFEPGVSTAEGGTGLGLAIVREIVDDHGWSIAVADADRGGARFEVRDVDLVADDA
jgi:PAS domain S-box-containing protein